jgi:uncharacterized protein YndB with AHSA1/START domain
MKSYEASATIEAPPESVWKVLVDGGSYNDWDSGVLALEGDIALGERLKVASEANPKRAFPVRVTEIEPARSMLGLIWRSMPDLGPSFEKFARGLKQRAERGA